MSVRRFLEGNEGAVTVEAVVWLPIYVIFFVLIADVSLMFHGQAKATRIAYDGNRQASLGALETEQAVETAVLARVQALSPNATVDTVFGTDTVTTTLTMPARDLLAIGSFAQFIDLDITVSSVHMLEV